ncbi:MAG: hypothetical protein QOJ15_586 [Bradyrhizobium sp.]|jgi:hypothetical protein|nr:hypothetical protein [Bradyrhizobium sp.]
MSTPSTWLPWRRVAHRQLHEGVPDSPVSTAVADGTSLYLRYESNVSGQDSAHALTAGVRMSW